MPSSEAAWTEGEGGGVKKACWIREVEQKKTTAQNQGTHQRSREQREEEDVDHVLSVRSSDGGQTRSSTWQRPSDGWARVRVEHRDPDRRLKQTLERNSHRS